MSFLFPRLSGSLSTFHLVGKVNNIEVYDDYAHHPTEIACTLEAAKTFGRRVIAVFQPHRFTRFSAFFNRFPESLKLADFVVATEVYAAGEKNESGLTTKQLVAKMDSARTLYIKNAGAIAGKLVPLLLPGDLVITLGAGDITHVSREIVQLLRSQE